MWVKRWTTTTIECRPRECVPMMSDVGSEQWYTLKVGELWWEWKSNSQQLSRSIFPQITRWRAEPLNPPYKTWFPWPPELQRSIAPDLGGAYFNLYGLNYDGSNPTHPLAPGNLEYNKPQKSGAFFGMPAQDAPSVCSGGSGLAMLRHDTPGLHHRPLSRPSRGPALGVSTFCPRSASPVFVATVLGDCAGVLITRLQKGTRALS